jgi:hypothetical protein
MARGAIVRNVAKAPAEGADPLGFYTPPFAYARMQVILFPPELKSGTIHYPCGDAKC